MDLVSLVRAEPKLSVSRWNQTAEEVCSMPGTPPLSGLESITFPAHLTSQPAGCST